MRFVKRTLLVAAVAVMACGGSPEIRVDETKGIPAVKGTTQIALASYTCGQPISSGDVTVTTTVVSGGCQFSFDKDVPVLKTTDYNNIPDFQGATNLVQRVELTVKVLKFSDATTGTALDPGTAITSASLSVNGQAVADKSTLTQLPKTVTLSGDALTQLKTKVDARQAASVHLTVVVVLPDTPKPPSQLKVDYDAQPALILGTGSLKF
jgi:hypothetical protein